MTSQIFATLIVTSKNKPVTFERKQKRFSAKGRAKKTDSNEGSWQKLVCVKIPASSHPIYANAANVCSIYDVITGFVLIGGPN